MSDLTRRDALRRLGLALAAAGTLEPAAAQEVHRLAAQAAAPGGGYVPQAFTAHEFATLERLTDLIVPVENGAPGAVAAGCAAWIDSLCSGNDTLRTIYTDGVAWLDGAMTRRGADSFLAAAPAAQTALLDRIAYRRHSTPELAPGIQFFSWVRRMTVDAFYTSEIGIKDIGYQGNAPRASFPAPDEAIAYALRRKG